MRVVSLVPSWTETLLLGGVEVVGRTRFCVHGGTEGIPVVGGTKDWNWPKIQALKPECILLDREENPKIFAEQSEIPIFSTHVTSVDDVAPALREMAERFSAPTLKLLARRWEVVLARPALPAWNFNAQVPLPGLLDWGLKPQSSPQNVVYIIWRDPWMAVSEHTFIGSVLGRVGFKEKLVKFETKYPAIALEDFASETTLLLFSSEPFPFLKRRSKMGEIRHAHAFVDGEVFSWFGLRTLEFLERTLRVSN